MGEVLIRDWAFIWQTEPILRHKRCYFLYTLAVKEDYGLDDVSVKVSHFDLCKENLLGLYY